ncbi:hypothetical protein RJD24_07645 [Bacillaceae bacterium IKA-2]|nr:hypothetical protein RJD24_07645 [Bacillaceae bacterium IKA-2]
MSIKKQRYINEKKGEKKSSLKSGTEVKVIVEVANELDTKKAVLEFYKVVKSERL